MVVYKWGAMHFLSPLEDVLNYRNELVIERFKINHPKDAHQAEQLFTDMLLYLWLCEKHSWDTMTNPNNPDLKFIPVMHEEMRSIDSMWHEFILITKDYHTFCHHYFGRFLHHEPNMQKTLGYDEAQFVNSLTLFLNYVYDILGEDVLTRWFEDHLKEVA